MKKVVYTVLFGDYRLNEPVYDNKNWELVCFTGQKITSKNWSIVNVDTGDDQRKKSREVKIRCDKYLDFDVCLYIDSKFTIKCDLDGFITKNFKNDLTLMKHNKRSCAYREGEFCINLGNVDKDVMLNQMKVYKQDGFPEGFGLYAPGIMIRKNSPEVMKFMKLWYAEVEKHSYRDQVSFPYIMWKNPIKFTTMPFKETYMRFK